jgi:hypothetical protein
MQSTILAVDANSSNHRKEEAMNWLLYWKVVLAVAAIVVTVNAVMLVVKTTRSAYQEWKAPRELVGK